MELTLIILTSIVLFSQFFLDYFVKTKKRKVQIGSAILVIGLIVIWFAFFVQKNDKIDTEESHKHELIVQQNRFNRLDSLNTVLETELKIRNNDLASIKLQNDSLKFHLLKVTEKQDQTLIISQYSAQEVNKSRVALENMGLKQISRSISEIDKIDMIRILKIHKGSKVGLKVIMGDNEAFQFAKQIQEIFEAAGWVVDGISQSVYNNVMQGIFIEIKSEKYPIRVNTIFESFKIINMVAKGNIDNRLGDNDVEILIGTK